MTTVYTKAVNGQLTHTEMDANINNLNSAKYESGNSAYFAQCHATDWFRPSGSTGLYFQSYGGGWHMTDSTWIRSYNSKNVYINAELQATTINTPSDINLKKDIVKIDDALDKLHKINGYNFTFKKTDKKSSGVIAQEVQKVMPQLVHEGADDGVLTVEYGNMVGLLIEAIKEQQTQIDDLKAEIQSIKS